MCVCVCIWGFWRVWGWVGWLVGGEVGWVGGWLGGGEVGDEGECKVVGVRWGGDEGGR